MLQRMFLILLCSFGLSLAFECPGDGNYSDPTSCNKYFQCKNGQAENQLCPVDELFSGDSRLCGSKDKVICPGVQRRSVETGKYKLVCYYPNWVGEREGATFTPSQIDPTLCTHINYAFAALDNTTNTIALGDPDVDKEYFKQMKDLKNTNPNLKLMLSLGGYEDSSGTKYSTFVANPSARQTFNIDVVDFLKKYSFDGLDIDWEYPSCIQGTCQDNSDDKTNFATWLQELRDLFDNQNPRLELSAAVSGVDYYIDRGYDIPSLSSALDHINIMGYDYSNSGNEQTGQNAPLKADPGMDPKLTVEYAMKYWVQLGAPASKLVLGFPSYGVGFTLKDPQNHGFGAPAKGPSTEGDFEYYKICKYVKEGWTKGEDDKAGAYAYSGDQWVGYDNPQAVARKAQFVVDGGYGGMMVWDITMDDYNGNCCGVKYPLVSVASNILNGNGEELSSVKCQ